MSRPEHWTPDLNSYERSKDTVERIYATDRKEGRSLSLNVAIAQHQLEADESGKMQAWLTEKKLDELGAALIRELYAKWEGREVMLVVTRVGHHPGAHVPEFRACFYVTIQPLKPVPAGGAPLTEEPR